MSDPRTQLEAVIETAIDTAVKELHTCLPGIVQNFDPVEQTADIQPTIKRKLNGEFVNLPLLTDVPVRFPKVCDFSITMPVKNGDDIEIRVIERSIDRWLLDGDIQEPDDTRKHSLSDAYATPLLYSQQSKITSFDNTNLQIRTTDGGSFINLTPSGVIELNGNADFGVRYNELETKLKELETNLNDFITVFNSHTQVVTGSTAAAPTTPAVASNVDFTPAKIDTVKVV